MKRLLATSVFTAVAYSLTLFAGALAASADAPAGVDITSPSTAYSPATAALISVTATRFGQRSSSRTPPTASFR